MKSSRRSFLRKTIAAGGGAAAVGVGALGARVGWDYRKARNCKARPVAPDMIEDIVTFHGEVFPVNPNRMFREGMFSGSPEPEREVEVLIVGGGAGGLTAAYRLLDRDILVLEALPEPGGNSMYCEWEGVPFSLGGQYIGAPGTWSDSVWELCRELNLEPLRDTSPIVVAFPGGLKIANPYSAPGFIRMPLPLKVKRDLVKFYFLDMPGIDVESRKDELDMTRFSEFLKGYSPEFRQWFELLAKSYPRTSDVSAYYGVSSAQGVEYASDEGAYSLPGGLGLINRTLARKIESARPGRVLTGAFVFRVRHDDEGRVLATYWRDGRVSTVRAKAAIVNAEANIALEIIEDIPADLKDAMGGMRRISYPTFSFCFREPVYRDGYRLGVMDCRDMQAITAQDWFSQEKGKERPNILTCFNKLTFENADMVKDRSGMVRMTARILGEIDLRFPGAIEKLEAVHVFLRTRNYAVPGPGYITGVFPKLGKNFGRIFFANAEYLDPITLFPEAVTAGSRAAEGVRKVLA